MAELRDLIEQLKDAISRDDFIDVAEEVVEELVQDPDSKTAIEPILRLMETHEDVDFGMPGPLVHFVEKFYRKGYEELLLESISRHATAHTLWMLNRIANGATGKSKKKFVDVLNVVANDPDCSEEARKAAGEFVEFHLK